MITAALNITDEFGIPIQLAAVGFHPDFRKREFHFFFCQVKFDQNGKPHYGLDECKTYTEDFKRQDVNEDMSPKFENGEPVMIGIFSFWEKTLGFGYIYPDLQDTLDSIGETYPN